MSNHEIDHADDLSSRVLHARAGGADGRLPSPTRTAAVLANTLRDVRRVDPGDELCIRNDAAVPIEVEFGLLPSVRLGLVDMLTRERDALAAQRDAAVRELVAFYRAFAAEGRAGLTRDQAAILDVASMVGLDAETVHRAAGSGDGGGRDD